MPAFLRLLPAVRLRILLPVMPVRWITAHGCVPRYGSRSRYRTTVTRFLFVWLRFIPHGCTVTFTCGYVLPHVTALRLRLRTPAVWLHACGYALFWITFWFIPVGLPFATVHTVAVPHRILRYAVGLLPTVLRVYGWVRGYTGWFGYHVLRLHCVTYVLVHVRTVAATAFWFTFGLRLRFFAFTHLYVLCGLPAVTVPTQFTVYRLCRVTPARLRLIHHGYRTLRYWFTLPRVTHILYRTAGCAIWFGYVLHTVCRLPRLYVHTFTVHRLYLDFGWFGSLVHCAFYAHIPAFVTPRGCHCGCPLRCYGYHTFCRVYVYRLPTRWIAVALPHLPAVGYCIHMPLPVTLLVTRCGYRLRLHLVTRVTIRAHGLRCRLHTTRLHRLPTRRITGFTFYTHVTPHTTSFPFTGSHLPVVAVGYRCGYSSHRAGLRLPFYRLRQFCLCHYCARLHTHRCTVLRLASVYVTVAAFCVLPFPFTAFAVSALPCYARVVYTPVACCSFGLPRVYLCSSRLRLRVCGYVPIPQFLHTTTRLPFGLLPAFTGCYALVLVTHTVLRSFGWVTVTLFYTLLLRCHLLLHTITLYTVTISPHLTGYIYG